MQNRRLLSVRYAGFLLLVMLVGGLMVSRSAVAETTTIQVLRPGTEDRVQAFLEPIIREFEAANPDIKVVPRYMGWFSWIETYKTLFGAGHQPDVVLWWDKALNDPAVASKLVPLDDYVDDEVLSAIPERLLEYAKVDGEIKLIPAASCSLLFMWRKDVFKEAGLDPERPPKTWEELFEYARQIKENTNVYPIGINVKADDALPDTVSSIYYTMTGKPWLDENHQPQFNTPEGVKALEIFRRLKDYAQPGAINQSRGDLRGPFRDGRIAMNFIDGSWLFPMLEEKYGEDLGPIGVASYPAGLAGSYAIMGMDGWVITNKNKAEAAGKFISFLASPEQQYEHTICYGVTPLYKEELEKERLQYDHWRTAKEVRDTWGMQRMGTGHPGSFGIEEISMDIFQQVWEDVLTPQEALNELEKRIIEFNKQLGIK